MIDEVQEILIDEETINKTVKSLAEQINTDYRGKNVVLLIILKGQAMGVEQCPQERLKFSRIRKLT